MVLRLRVDRSWRSYRKMVLCLRICIWGIYGGFWRRIRIWTLWRLVRIRLMRRKWWLVWYWALIWRFIIKVWKNWGKLRKMLRSISKKIHSINGYFILHLDSNIANLSCLWYRQSLWKLWHIHFVGRASQSRILLNRPPIKEARLLSNKNLLNEHDIERVQGPNMVCGVHSATPLEITAWYLPFFRSNPA
jgi:hypothetical protein